MLPVNLLVLTWVWIGRGLLVPLGWFVVLMFGALPFVLAALMITAGWGVIEDPHDDRDPLPVAGDAVHAASP